MALCAHVQARRHLVVGDNVRIDGTESTRASGHANRVGVCYGLTTPSVTAEEVVGATTNDVALDVHFDDEDVEDAWFAVELVSLPLITPLALGSRSAIVRSSRPRTVTGSRSRPLPAVPA